MAQIDYSIRRRVAALEAGGVSLGTPGGAAKLGTDGSVGGPGGSPVTPPSVTKRVTYPIGSNGVSPSIVLNGSAPAPFNQRQLILSPATTTRWRLRVQNVSVSADGFGGAPYPGAIPVTGMWIGRPNFAPGAGDRWDGSFRSNPPVQAVAAFTMPADGSEYISPWVTNPTMQLTRNRLHGLSYGATAPTNQSLADDGGGGLLWWGTGADAQAPLQSVPVAPNFSPALVLFDMRIEFEFTDSLGQQIGLFIGDSITWGFGSDNAAGFAYRHESFPGQAGIRNGFVPINAGIGGAGSADWNSLATNRRFTRLDLATTVPDFAVISLGTNDLVGCAPGQANTTKANLKQLIDNLRQQIGIDKIYVCTQIPRNFPVALTTPVQSAPATATTGGTGLAAATAYYYKVSALGAGGETLPSNEQTVTTGAGGTNSNTVNWAAVPGATGYRVYRGTVAGAENVYYAVGAVTTFTDTGAAGTAGSPLATSTSGVPETERQLLNAALGDLPNGVQGCFDMDRVMRSAANTNQMDALLGTNPNPHPFRRGYSVMGERINIGRV
ncbi:MAG: hypothetical protein NVS3B1_07870 [Marmoricola sp.]